jgi:DNA modification methylase
MPEQRICNAILRVGLGEQDVQLLIAEEAAATIVNVTADTAVRSDAGLTVTLPIELKRRQGAAVIEAPGAPGGAGRIDRALVRAVALARSWSIRLASGDAPSIKTLALSEGYCDHYAARLLPLGEGPSVIQPGDLWLLGAHRLLCGDALNSDTWSQLMAGERAALVVTDPPFNVPIDGHVSGGGRHRHREFAQASGEMSAEAFTAFLQEAMTLACQWSADGALGYWAMDWRHVVEIGTAGLAAYDRFINMAVWAKNQPGMGSFYRSQHELFFVFAKGGAPYRNNVQLGRFGRSRSNVWSYPSAASLARTAEEGNPLAMHPTVKPLALISDILLDASVRGDLVADPFAGSGTTLIAAEKLGRRARVLEIDSAYCDAILTRWQKWTGETARRARDGVAFADAAAVVCGRAGDVPTLR